MSNVVTLNVMKKGFIKKADIVLAAVLLALGFGGMLLLHKSADENSCVLVSVDGKEIASYALGTDRSEIIETQFGYNRLVIKDNRASISDADCGNKDCMSFGWISKEGEIIVCLPHRLMVKIVSSDGLGGDEIDSVAY